MFVITNDFNQLTGLYRQNTVMFEAHGEMIRQLPCSGGSVCGSACGQSSMEGASAAESLGGRQGCAGVWSAGMAAGQR